MLHILPKGFHNPSGSSCTSVSIPRNHWKTLFTAKSYQHVCCKIHWFMCGWNTPSLACLLTWHKRSVWDARVGGGSGVGWIRKHGLNVIKMLSLVHGCREETHCENFQREVDHKHFSLTSAGHNTPEASFTVNLQWLHDRFPLTQPLLLPFQLHYYWTIKTTPSFNVRP